MGKCKYWWSFIIAICLLCVTVGGVLAEDPAVDGVFADWAEQGHVNDPTGDGTPNTDIVAFYFWTTPNQERCYFMMQRVPPQSGNPAVFYGIFLDTNNNGTYTDPTDRMLLIYYNPRQNDSEVSLTVLSANGQVISQSGGDWGESMAEGGSRVEWSVSFQDLGIYAHQTVNMFAMAAQSRNLQNADRVPDSGDITWTPIPALGLAALIAVVAIAIGLTWHKRGRYMWSRS